MVLVGSSVAASSQVANYPVLAGQATRYTLGAVVLAAFARGGRLPRLGPPEILRLLALAATGLAGFNVFLVAALREADAGNVGVIIGCVSLALAVVGPVLAGRPPSRRVLAAALVVSAGAAFVQWSGEAMSLAGLALALGALVCEAAFSLLAVPLLGTLGPVGVSTYACVAAAAMLFVGAVGVDGSRAFRLPTPQEALAFAYLALAVTALAFVLWYSAVRRMGVEQAGLFAGLVPVAALVGSAAVGTAGFSLMRLFGALAVSAGVTLGMRAGQQRSLDQAGSAQCSCRGVSRRPVGEPDAATKPDDDLPEHVGILAP
jgi:drug/metabolite transporter (DMT)-like permease